MRESDIEKYLVHCVKRMGGEVRKVSWIGRRGAPDRFVMLPLREDFLPGSVFPAMSIWVELKAPSKKAEPHQLREHERMRKLGQHVVVIDSFEGVDALMRGDL